MAIELLDNAVSIGTTRFLVSDIDETADVLPVDGPTSTTLSGVGQFRVIVVDVNTGAAELMLVTANQWTANWTVERGIEGTTPIKFSTGSVVKHTMTREGFLTFIQQSPGQFGVLFEPGGLGDDTLAWQEMVAELSALGGGIIHPLATQDNPIWLEECDLLPNVHVEGAGWGASWFAQKAGARWCLRATTAEGAPATGTVDDCRISNVAFDQNGQVGKALMMEGSKRNTVHNVYVINSPNSGTWSYDDLSGLGTQTYRSGGIMVKGVSGKSGPYYNKITGFLVGTNAVVTHPPPVPVWDSGTTYAIKQVAFVYNNVYRSVINGNLNHNPATDDGSHWVVVTSSSKFANWQWSAIAIYNMGNVAIDPTDNQMYVSLTNANSGGNQPSLDNINWARGSWHTLNTFAANDAVRASDGKVYVSQVDGNTGHDPTTDSGANWKLGAAGLELTSTTETAGQKANDNVIQGQVGGMAYGVLGQDGWDYHIDGAGSDFSNCFVALYVNGSRIRISDLYAEQCQIAILAGTLSRDLHIVGKGSFSQTVTDLINLGYRTSWKDRREGDIGYRRSRPAMPLSANASCPIVDGLELFYTNNSVATNLWGFQADPGNPQISDDGFSTDPPGGVLNGVEFMLYINDANTLIKDASGNVTRTGGAMTAGTLAGNARLTDPSNPWSASDVGKWIQVQGAGRGGGVLTAFIKTYENAGSIILTNVAAVTVSGATYTYGSAFKLASGKDYLASVGDVLRFRGIFNQFVQIGTTYKQVTTPTSFLPLPTGVAATDTVNLNTVLARGGRIRPNPLALTAAYSITAPLVVPSNIDVDFGGCTFTLTGQFNMLQNAACTPAYSATDASTSVGVNVVTSATLAPHAVAGMSLAVVGAGATGGAGTPGQVWLYGRVLSVAGNNITLTGNVNGVAASVAVSGATAYLFNRDSNIKMQGGTFDSAAIWNVLADRQTAGFNSNLIRLRRIDGLTVRGVAVKSNTFSGGTKGWAFGVNPGDCTDFWIDDINGINSSTSVQGDGPLTRGRITNIRGNTQDDQTALGCVSYGGNDVEGDITDVEIDGIQANGSLRALTLFAGQGANDAYRKMLNITARSIKGTTVNEPVRLVDYAGKSWIGANIEDVSAVGSAGQVMINVTAGAAQHISFRDIVWPYDAPVAVNGVISCGDHVAVLTIKNLTVRGQGGNYIGVALNNVAGKYNSVTVDGLFQPDSGLANFNGVVLNSGTIDYLSVKNVAATAPGNVVYGNGGDPVVVDIQDGYQNNAASVIYASQSATGAVSVKIAQFTSVGVNAVVVRRPMVIFFDGVDVNESGAIVSVLGANATPVRIIAPSLRQNGTGALVTRDATQAVSTTGSAVLGTQVDVAILSPQDGDTAYNNTSASGPTGAVVYRTKSGLWVALGGNPELKYAEVTANQTGISAVTDLTGLSITFKAPASGSVWLEWWIYSVQQQTSTGIPSIVATDSSNTVVGQSTPGTLLAGTFSADVLGRRKITGLTPGTSYTYKLRASTSAGTCITDAGATYPAFLRAVAV